MTGEDALGGVEDAEEIGGIREPADMDEYEGEEDDKRLGENSESELKEELKANINDLPRSGLSLVMWKMLLEFVKEDAPGRRFYTSLDSIMRNYTVMWKNSIPRR